MRIIETTIPGCLEIELPACLDPRGSFVKNFHESQFRAHGLETHFPEEFYSKSVAGVLRGLHFMAPPHDQIKVVTCLHGSVLDAVVDLRRGSPTFGKHVLIELSAGRSNMLYMERGMAHGFYVPSGEAILLYRVSSMYSSRHDEGIRWDSAGIPWPGRSPLVSPRDAALPAFDAFESPFEFERVCG
ncbi:MAG: dTDP-4-dehydrorhamnose 3,5-epimerase family protein [Bryobacteraceae bacterium]|jgi:dTDP-4-dehydrorhamnose 3,5-epimerase